MKTANSEVEILLRSGDTMTMCIPLDVVESLTAIRDAIRCPFCKSLELARKSPKQAIYCFTCGMRAPSAKDEPGVIHNIILENLEAVIVEEDD